MLIFSKIIKNKFIKANRCFVVAEISANHSGNFNNMRKLIYDLKKINVQNSHDYLNYFFGYSLNLNEAISKAKKDEFYTQLEDIEREMRFYKKHFKGKTVLCNCDDPRISNFFHYFSYNFENLKLKKFNF